MPGGKSARALAVVLAGLGLFAAHAPAQESSEPTELESLDADAQRLYFAGRYGEAIPLAERALSIRERAVGPEHPDLANAIHNLAMLYQAAGDYAGATILFERLLAIKTENLGPEDPAVAVTASNLGMLHWAKGENARAAEYLERALSISERAHGPDHVTVAVALSNLAAFHRSSGDVERAESLYQRALAVWDTTPDPDRDQLLGTLRNLADIQLQRGDYERAEPFFERALAFIEATRGASHLEMAVALNSLVSLYFASSDYERSKPLLEQVLAIAESASGPEHLDVAAALSNLASLQLAMGDDTRAESLFERALAIRSKALGEDHLVVSSSLENLASLYRAHGDFERSLALCERVLAIREKALGSEHLEVARARGDLAKTEWALGDFASAQSHYEQALLVREKALGSENSAVADYVDNLASTFRVRGNFERAGSLYERALAIREAQFGPEHPSVSQSLRNLALMYWAQRDFAQAEIYLSRSAEAEERQIELLLPARREAQVRAFMQGLSDSTDLILSFQRERPDAPSVTRLALTTLLRRKGRALDLEAGGTAAIRGRLGEDERSIFDRLVERRRELGRLVDRGFGAPRPDSSRARAEPLRAELDALEKAAAGAGAALRLSMARIRIEDLQPRIPADAALVEFAAYRDFDPTRIRSDRADGKLQLGAFVLRAAGDPQWVPLGKSAAIDASVRAFRKSLLDQDRSSQEVRARSRDLYDRLVAPLDTELEGVKTLFLAPDGATSLVPFGALIDPAGRFWIERYALSYLTAGRDLLLVDSAVASQVSPVVIAAPDYDAVGLQASAPIGEPSPRRSSQLELPRFAPLAESETGASEIANLLGVTPIIGAQATDAAIRSVHAPRVLHLASDAFYLPEADRESTLRWSWLLGIDSPVWLPASENPLLRAGVALAGANRRSADEPSGLLTALQIADLDLSGTQLFAISARGLDSEGVAIDRAAYALRRSLVIAGAQSQLATLWTAEPRAASELMTAYYQRLLAGEGRSEALRNVQLAMLRSERHAHPFYWASFIPIGARGPIAWTDSSQVVRERDGSQASAHP